MKTTIIDYNPHKIYQNPQFAARCLENLLGRMRDDLAARTWLSDAPGWSAGSVRRSVRRLTSQVRFMREEICDRLYWRSWFTHGVRPLHTKEPAIVIRSAGFDLDRLFGFRSPHSPDGVGIQWAPEGTKAFTASDAQYTSGNASC